MNTPPTQAGELLEDVMEYRVLDVATLAADSDMPQNVLLRLIDGTYRFSMDCSERLGRALNLPLDFWHNIQQLCDRAKGSDDG